MVLGRSAKLELIRRFVPLALAVLGIAGALTFLSMLSGLLCLAAAVGIYCALPRTRLPAGAVRPDISPGTLVSDGIGFLIGGPLSVVALFGAQLMVSPTITFLFLLLFLPASLCVPIFMASIRHETSWMRFFGNGFEVTQLGRTARLRYTDLQSMSVRQIRMPRSVSWLASFFGGYRPDRIAMLGGREDSKTLVFVSKGGMEVLASSEVIPDLQRILIGMDRAGVELPAGISERERKKIRRVRKRLYKEPAEPETEQLDVARIAATVRKYQQRKA